MPHELPDLKSDQKVFVDNETYYFNCLKEREYQLLTTLGEFAALRASQEDKLGVERLRSRMLGIVDGVRSVNPGEFTFSLTDSVTVTISLEDAQRQYGVHLKRIAELEKALEIAVEDISDMDRGATYKTSAYISAAKRRLSGDYVAPEVAPDTEDK